MIADYDAIILAGGRGSRLGGVRKPELSVAGRRLIDIALAAVGSANRVVVVGDADVPTGIAVTREDPPYGGPVEAVAAGVRYLDDPAEWTLLLAADLPGAEAAVARLLAAEPGPDDDGICLLDSDDRLQWLLGCYRSTALRSRLADRGDPPLTAMHRLLSPLRLRGIDPAGAVLDDIDTPADAQRWGASSGGACGPGDRPSADDSAR